MGVTISETYEYSETVTFKKGDVVHVDDMIGSFKFINHGTTEKSEWINIYGGSTNPQGRRQMHSVVPSRVHPPRKTTHVPHPKSEAKQPKTRTFPDCTCGCGGKTRGGLFLPGHDARLRGQLVKCIRGEKGHEVVVSVGGPLECVDKMVRLGWARFVPEAEYLALLQEHGFDGAITEEMDKVLDAKVAK